MALSLLLLSLSVLASAQGMGDSTDVVQIGVQAHASDMVQAEHPLGHTFPLVCSDASLGLDGIDCVKLSNAECRCNQTEMSSIYGKGFQFNTLYDVNVEALEAFDKMMMALGLQSNYSISSGTALGFARGGAVIPFDSDGDVVLPASVRRQLSYCVLAHANMTEGSDGKFNFLTSGTFTAVVMDIQGKRFGFTVAEEIDALFREYHCDYVVALNPVAVERLSGGIAKGFVKSNASATKTDNFGRMFTPSLGRSITERTFVDMFMWSNAKKQEVWHDSDEFDNDEFDTNTRRVRINDVEVSCFGNELLAEHLRNKYGSSWSTSDCKWQDLRWQCQGVRVPGRWPLR